MALSGSWHKIPSMPTSCPIRLKSSFGCDESMGTSDPAANLWPAAQSQQQGRRQKPSDCVAGLRLSSQDPGPRLCPPCPHTTVSSPGRTGQNVRGCPRLNNQEKLYFNAIFRKIKLKVTIPDEHSFKIVNKDGPSLHFHDLTSSCLTPRALTLVVVSIKLYLQQ